MLKPLTTQHLDGFVTDVRLNTHGCDVVEVMIQGWSWHHYANILASFLQFHALLVSGHPHLIPSLSLRVGSAADAADPGIQKRPPGLQVSLWTRQVQHCMACHQLWQFKGSTLALAIITLELEVLVADWFPVFTDLLKKAHVDSADFIHCKEIVDEYLHSLEFSLPANAVYILDGSQIQQQFWSPSLHRRLARRGHGGEDRGELDYYDGFKRLYNEESNPESEAVFEPKQKGVSCPPLHPAVH
uniref:Cyclin I family, member 2 n=1 Tax=Nothobranchius rachovii TaxID=451742 RepID=A0A1A8P1Y7_9TELE